MAGKKGPWTMNGVKGGVPLGPAIPAGGPRKLKPNRGAFMLSPPISRNKKGRAGSRAGLRGSPREPKLASISTAKTPKGPSPFSSTKLPARGKLPATPAPAAKKPSLLNRIFNRVRGK